jgi:aspartyl protease family protein
MLARSCRSLVIMLRNLIFFVIAAMAASQIPYLMGLTGLNQEPDPQPESVAVLQTAASPAVAASGTVTVSADRRGHFVTTVRLNGKPVEGMIDTGASSIAINETTARRLGFTANSLKFEHPVQTANGETKVAVVMLDRVELDGIRVRNVQAVVGRDEALSGTLIGMTFLKRLSSFQVENGMLRLVQ